ncbi:hypothetical protein AVEN_235882-1 [Araneus ventricosus]|uniref:Uncharacterized protein n=1 Tax=Araneus ventricosus TaxID=182803 RepID=A0A4Y2R0R9_ARAVE|nr:hypothetical protein AVEN_235882-1 [Araneus ventricosus]
MAARKKAEEKQGNSNHAHRGVLHREPYGAVQCTPVKRCSVKGSREIRCASTTEQTGDWWQSRREQPWKLGNCHLKPAIHLYSIPFVPRLVFSLTHLSQACHSLEAPKCAFELPFTVDNTYVGSGRCWTSGLRPQYPSCRSDRSSGDPDACSHSLLDFEYGGKQSDFIG